MVLSFVGIGCSPLRWRKRKRVDLFRKKMKAERSRGDYSVK
jgi:hypothetical protein